METTADIHSRTEALLGADGMRRLASTRVLIFGVGGVGSWCAEALIRSGLGHLTMVDPDAVCYSNLNRQLPATLDTIGRPKVEVLRERFLRIHPEAEIIARAERYSAETADQFALQDYDYIIDAIDSVADKAELILRATALQKPVLLSSMGAARRFDPTRVRVSEFWKIEGDPLARAIRQWFKNAERYPERKFRCVWSDELPSCPQGTKGSLMPVTASFGLTLASIIINSAIQ